jgi:hypothetical protein
LTSPSPNNPNNPSNPSSSPSSSSSTSKGLPSLSKPKQIGDTQLDWALERECEIERLEAENRALREMLGLGVTDPDGEGSEAGGVMNLGEGSSKAGGSERDSMSPEREMAAGR